MKSLGIPYKNGKECKKSIIYIIAHRATSNIYRFYGFTVIQLAKGVTRAG